MHDDLEKLSGAELLASIREAVQQQLAPFGEALADYCDYGSLVCGGTQGTHGRRWVYVIATNDAADDLEAWAREQATGRLEAAHRAGLPVVGTPP